MNGCSAELLTYVSGICGREVQLDTPLLDEGLIDSFNILEILAYLETRFNVRIDPLQVTTAEFSSVGSISRLITRSRP